MAVFSGIAAAAGLVGTWFAGLGVFGQVAVRLVAGFAFNAISRAFAGKPDKPRRPGITGQIQQGADLPRSFILGRYATPGSLVYHNTWGGGGSTPNAYYTRATALSDLPVSGLVAVWVDGERMEVGATPDPDGLGYPLLGLSETRTTTRQVYDGEHPRGGPTYRTEDESVEQQYGWVRFHDGTQTAADSLLVNNAASAERPWSAQEVGVGVAYAVTTFKLNRRKFNRLPELIFEIDGVPLTAPDGTDAGASRNPIVQVWHLLKVFAWNGETIYGPATPAHLDATEWQAQADLCDQPVPGADQMSAVEKEEAFGSTTVPARYRSGLEVDVSRDVADVIEDVLSACNGRPAYVGAGYRVQVGDPQAAVATLTDADILSTTGQSFAPFFALAETVNSVAGTYPDPDEAWQRQEAPPLIVADYEAEEGGRRLPTTVDLPAVPYREQVQRLMQSALAEARRARRHTVTLPARYWTLLPGDHLDWNSTRNGYAAKRFRVDGLVDLPNGDVQVDLTEVDPSDYDWSADTDYAPVARGSITGQAVAAVSVAGFALAAAVVSDGTGEARRPAILLSWDDPESDDVAAVRWQVRLPDGRAVSAGRTPDVELLAHYIVEGILPAQTYQVRARLDAPGRPTPWTPWTSITTLDVRLTAADIASDLRDTIETAFARHDTALADAAGTVAELRDAALAAYGPLDAAQSLDTRVADNYTTIGSIQSTLTGEQARLDGVADDLAIETGRIDATIRRLDPVVPAQRNAAEALEQISDAVTEVASRLFSTDQRMASAGITVDPETGLVQIAAAEAALNRSSEVEIKLDAAQSNIELRATYAYVNEAIAAAQLDPESIPLVDDLKLRMTAAEVDIDALEGSITAKAETATVNGIDTRLVTAEADIDTLESTITLKVDQADFDAVESRLSSAEVELDTLDGAAIRQTVIDTRSQFDALEADELSSVQDLIDAFHEREALRTGVAFAQSEIYASVNEQMAAAAGERQTIAVAVDGARAAIEQERLTRVTEDAALAESITALQADVTNAEGEIAGTAAAVQALDARVEDTEDGIVSAAKDRTTLVSGIGAAARAIEEADDQSVEDLWRRFQRDQELRDGIAFAQSEIYTVVEENRLAEAAERTALAATLDDTAALVVTESIARATADEALAESITQLEVTLSTAEGDITANASAIGGLTTRVSDVEGEVTAVSSDVSSLQTSLSTAEGDILANTSAIGGLDTRITTAEGDITSISTDVSSLSTSLTNAEGDILANTSAVGGLDTRVTSAEGSITAISSDVTALETTVNDPVTGVAANSNAIGGLDTRVTSAEGSITTISSDVSALQVTVNDPATGIGANATAIGGLDTRITNAEVDIATISSDVTTLSSSLSSAEVDIAANSSAIGGLTTRVDGTEGDITALATDATLLEASLTSANLILNGEFITGDFNGWVDVTPQATVAPRIGSADAIMQAAPLPFALVLPYSSSPLELRNGKDRTVTPGDVLDVSFWVATAGASVAKVRASFYDAEGGYLSFQNRSVTTNGATSWQLVSTPGDMQPITVPANAAEVRLFVRRDGGGFGALYVTDLRVARRSAAARDVTARVTDLEVTRVTPEGAVAAAETEISAEYDGLQALASATAFAEATVDGIKEGFVWELGGSDVLSLVRVDDGSSPTTTARIKGDYIRLDGTVEVAGDFLVGGGNIVLDGDTTVTGAFSVENANIAGGIFSDDYVAGVSGWGIFKAGGAQLPATAILGQLSADSVRIDGTTLDTDGSGNLIVRQAGIGTTQLAAGAVSDSAHIYSTPYPPGFIDVTSTSYVEIARLPPVDVVSGRKVRLDFAMNIEADQGPVAGMIAFERRVSADGGATWGSWDLIRVTDTGRLESSIADFGMTPVSHTTADLRNASETREYRLIAKIRNGTRMRLCRLDFGAEQIKR